MIRTAILTISDRVSAGTYDDATGALLKKSVDSLDDFTVTDTAVVPDHQNDIEAWLTKWSTSGVIDLIFTTGGTGLGPRDVTPEATLAVADREVPGIGELLRRVGSGSTLMTALSRQVAVQKKNCLIVNLPGSPRGASEGLATLTPLLAHAIGVMNGAGH